MNVQDLEIPQPPFSPHNPMHDIDISTNGVEKLLKYLDPHKAADKSGKKAEATDIWKIMIEVLQNCRFMVFFVSSVTTFTVVFCPATFLPDLMRDARYNLQEISWCVMIMGFGNLIGRLINGTFASKFNNHVPWIHGITLLGFAATTTLTITSHSLTSLIVLSALLGLFSGGYFGLHMAVVAHYLKRSQIPVGFGMIVAANGVSSTAGVPLAGLVSDAFDGEKGSFVFGGCVMFIAALVLSVNMVKEFFVRWTSDVEAKDEYNVEVHYENEITHL
ncbi:monocarboxylate transporter 14-like [Mercenaria mercenaria]|uniref:monocarboxylate transporter 14-like n=1 Tax=Mercenaria mercenaria TaxID=6596 RepID=UPI00234EAB1A|nr:monocarboxylate transporter 14-like [Mercenaria mercenaria]